MKSIVIVAGGTGGHISPGVALAEVLTELKEKIGYENLYLYSLVRNKNNPDLEQAPCPVLWHNLPPLSSNFFSVSYSIYYPNYKDFFLYSKN
ncbi:UDP-N-acetylglucosamine--N-acetylmuramyl-(pentapeptide) pyrophosphoryl-undecaprenol N-acetylglucosamine transferase [Leptospira interrogans]|nr:UDP-N-acetylglucosamine--N-acetylmuramyl-(pentapeptide) pyrophosphoryl-undecaprenol N-acetylglucosamine transferase [Leptospira interrogans]